MLTHLTVSDIALVDHLELDLAGGMTVISGETGAGKSIMLDALGLALGDRAETGMIAPKAEKSEIVATFDIDGNDAALAFLAERELDAGDNECILRRVIGKDGRSRGFINGIPSTVADMKSLGNLLIDIHSQHEHQSLLRRETHRRLLDEYGDHLRQAGELADVADAIRETRATLAGLTRSNEEQASRLQLLTYQSQELEALDARVGEATLLEQEQKMLSGAEAIIGRCSEAAAILGESDEGNASELLNRAITLLSSIDVAAAGAIVELLEASLIQLDEAARDLSRFVERIEVDPARLREVEARLTALYDMSRKHHVEPDELPELSQRIAAEISRLGNIDEEVAVLRGSIETLEADYRKRAEALDKARRKTAKRLESAVTSKLEGLGMKGAALRIAFTPRESSSPSPLGISEIEFLIAANPGVPARPLAKVASGGELSRLSLAIQVVTADTSRVPTLVFDEVDVGIGGGTAEVVGTLLRHLGTRAQIICVTHLPQVAAQGHTHFSVQKTTSGKTSRTTIEALDEKQRIREIARMLGGIEVTDQSLAHAREMFERAQG